MPRGVLGSRVLELSELGVAPREIAPSREELDDAALGRLDPLGVRPRDLDDRLTREPEARAARRAS